MKFLNKFRKKIEDKTLIRNQEAEIKQLKKTIDGIIDRREKSHKDHVNIHENDLDKRETEIREEAQVKLNKKDEMIDYLKRKQNQNKEVYDILNKKKGDLEQLIFKINNYLDMADNYQKESISWMATTKGEIESFLTGFTRLEKDILPKIES